MTSILPGILFMASTVAQAPWRPILRQQPNNWFSMGLRAVADLDGNGFPDIVGGGNPVRRIDNLGPDGLQPEHVFFTFQNPLLLSTFNKVIAADVDRDRDLDLLILRGSGAPDPRFVNSLLINDGAGNFTDQTAQRWPTGQDATLDLAVVDVNGDGIVDIVECNHVTQHRLYFGQPGGTFVDVTINHMPIASGGGGMAVGDVDGDGSPDIVIANPPSGDYLLLNDGAGHFSNESLRLAGRLYSGAYALGDVDGDGDLDLVCAVPVRSSELLRNDGFGFFTLDPNGIPPITRFPGYDDHRTVQLLDLDADGDLDILFYGGPRRFFFNDGSGRFSEVPLPAAAQVPACYSEGPVLGFLPADMDLDGDLDLVCQVGYCPVSSGTIEVLYSLSRHLSAPAPPQLGQGYVAEFDGMPRGVGILGLSFGSTFLPVPGYGNLQLDPGSLYLWPNPALLDATGHGSLTLPVPNVQVFAGLRLYLQGLTLERSSVALVLTNAFGETVVR